MSGYLAIVLAVTVPSAINGCVRGYEIYSERRMANNRLRTAADRKAAK